MHLFWLSWELWTLNKSKCCRPPRLPLVILRCCTVRHQGPVSDLSVPWLMHKQPEFIKNRLLCCRRRMVPGFISPYAAHTFFRLISRGGGVQPGTWLSPEFQLAQRKQASTRSKTGGFVAQTYRTEPLSIATIDGEGNRRRTIALCDPCSGRRGSATFLWQNTVNSPPCRQVSL